MKLDIGCGREPKQGFIGVDRMKFPEVDVVLDISKKKWPWKDNSVEEIWCSHMVEHLNAKGRIHFVNEAYRVLQSGGILTIVTPYWNNHRAFGDLTHEWPPVSESWYKYLQKQWREFYTPHNTEYRCDYTGVIKHAINDQKEIEDMAAILTKI